MFCAPAATFDPVTAAMTTPSEVMEGQSTISSRSCPATSGKNALTKFCDSAGVLYIFQLAAISALRGMSDEILVSILCDYVSIKSDTRHKRGCMSGKFAQAA